MNSTAVRGDTFRCPGPTGVRCPTTSPRAPNRAIPSERTSASASGIPTDTPELRATCRAKGARSCASTAPPTSTISRPTAVVPSATRSIPSASRPESCGAMVAPTAKSFTSTSSSATCRTPMSVDHHHPTDLAPVEARVAAIEAVLVEKGILDVDAVDSMVRTFEETLGPMNGAKVVARAWTDPAFKQRLLTDGTATIKALGFTGPEGDHMVVVENTPEVHNLVVCTLCSCYPWPVLGLPPSWYKSPAYRSRAVREPRKLLAEMGTVIEDHVEIRVWDSSAEARYMVLPMRPAGTGEMTEDQLAAVVTRDSMIGV